MPSFKIHLEISDHSEINNIFPSYHLVKEKKKSQVNLKNSFELNVNENSRYQNLQVEVRAVFRVKFVILNSE